MQTVIAQRAQALASLCVCVDEQTPRRSREILFMAVAQYKYVFHL